MKTPYYVVLFHDWKIITSDVQPDDVILFGGESYEACYQFLYEQFDEAFTILDDLKEELGESDLDMYLVHLQNEIPLTCDGAKYVYDAWLKDRVI